MIVPDAHADPRFTGNSLVFEPPHLRFYAGFPLITADGFAIGTQAVMDHVPRGLDPLQHRAMEVLAHQVIARLQLRRNLATLEQLQAQVVRANQTLDEQVERRTRELAQVSAAQAKAEYLYRMLWETTSDAVVILDRDNIIRYANPSTQRVFGHAAEQLIGSPLATLQPAHLRQAHQHGLQRYLDTGIRRLDSRAAEAVGLHADGHPFAIEIAFAEFSLDQQHLFVGFIRDITARKGAETALVEEKERAQTTLRCIGDAVVSTDSAGQITFLNAMAQRLCGWSLAKACDQPCTDILVLLDQSAGHGWNPWRAMQRQARTRHSLG